MIDIADVACCLVTRGDVDMQPVLDSLPFSEVAVWDNSKREDLMVYGRFAVIAETTKPYIYTQDDDAVCPVEQIVEAYQDGLLVNVAAGEKPWLAWGALFPREWPLLVFKRYLERYPEDLFFHRWPDVVFAHIAGWSTVDFGHSDLPWATAPNRMYFQNDHYHSQDLMRARVAELAVGAPPERTTEVSPVAPVVT